MSDKHPFTPPGPLTTPVLFLIYKRPDTTRQVLEAIRQAKPPRLYLAADRCTWVREGEERRDWKSLERVDDPGQLGKAANRIYGPSYVFTNRLITSPEL